MKKWFTCKNSIRSLFVANLVKRFVIRQDYRIYKIIVTSQFRQPFSPIENNDLFNHFHSYEVILLFFLVK